MLAIILLISFSGCSIENKDVEEQYQSRAFRMGFSTWPFGPGYDDKKQTMSFLSANADVYSEQIDSMIPWKALTGKEDYPEKFVDDIDFRAANKINNARLLLSVSLLNTDRSNLLADYDGSVPDYNSLDDAKISEAYCRYLKWLIDWLEPYYLIIAMEANELYYKNPGLWSGYKSLIQRVRDELKREYPALLVSESITLHNLYLPELQDTAKYHEEMKNVMAGQDFTAISFYPFFKGFHTKDEFQKAFDFLHSMTDKPIAFSETAHLAENLDAKSFNVHIKSNGLEQNSYLECLLDNANKHGYEFIIWWAHMDYEKLLEVFPTEARDIGRLWRDTGLIDQDGKERPAYFTWKKVLSQTLQER